jgi:DnaK suppressor protein
MLDTLRYEALKGLLERRRELVRDRLARHRREAEDDDRLEAPDLEDRGAVETSRSAVLELAELDRTDLTAIDEALTRLEVGGYGVCSDCGGEITAARLAALPFAVLCQSCQKAREIEVAARVRGV